MLDESWSTVINKEKAWHDARRSTVGSSDIPIILGISPYKTPLDLWKIKTGKVHPEESNFAQQRGKDMEPIARDWFCERMGYYYEPKDFKIGRHTASLDGYNEVFHTGVEIKFNGKENHELAKQGKVPPVYLAQVHWQYYVACLEGAHYLSYQEGNSALVEVAKPEAHVITMLQHYADAFLDLVDTVTQPPLTDRDYLEAEDPTGKVIEFQNTKDKKLRLDIIKMAEELNHPRVMFGTLKVIKTAKGWMLK